MREKQDHGQATLWRPCVFAVLALAAGLANAASAQTVVTGHNQPMFAAGLKSGVLPTRVGPIFRNSTIFYHSADFRDNEGNIVPGENELNIWANRFALIWLPGIKIARADYATALAVSIANLAPIPAVVQGQTQETGFGFGDLIWSPATLGWHWTNVHMQFAYTLFMPTGRFELGAPDNTGKGFFTNMLHLAVTWMPKVARPWHASLMTRYEIHTNQRGRDLRPGDTLTLELGVGKKVAETVDVGVIAHLWRQVTKTTGRDAMDPLKYRSYGLGAEVVYVIAKRFPAKARVGGDFGARNVSQGPWVIVEFNFPF